MRGGEHKVARNRDAAAEALLARQKSGLPIIPL